jgi:ArsR family transcriptional regulator
MNIARTEIFASLGNETRLRCPNLAAKYEEVCVCEVVDALKISQPSASKALKVLKSAGIVTDRRDANWVYYRLDESMPEWVATIMAAVLGEFSRSGAYAADERRFERSRIREQEVC